MRNFHHFKPMSVVFAIFTLVATVACAHGNIWNSQGQPSNYKSLIQSLITQKVIILGENHGLKTHQNQHLAILQSLRQAGLQVHVGLEFFSYPNQAQVQAYRLGQISEVDFLKGIQWGQPSYDYYRAQALFPNLANGEMTWALNAPRSLTGQISRVGIAGLSPELKALMPPYFQIGRESYRKRFFELLGGGGHFQDPQVANRYFEAQSTWDDTMAWRIQEILKAYPRAVVVVIVGEFHVQYGGGLPDRLRARGIKNVAVVSQVNTQGLAAQQVLQEVRPHAEYGPRADWIWSAPAVE